MRSFVQTALVVAFVAPFAIFPACSSDDDTGATALGPDAALDTGSRPDGTGDAGIEASLAQIGSAIVDAKHCHRCHDSAAGEMAGNGNGLTYQSDAGDTTIYTPNLTPDPDTGLGTAANGWSDEQIARAIRTGVDDECKTLCSVMPKFDFSDAEVAAVIAYLRSLPPIKNDVSAGCPDLDPAHGGGGEDVPDAGDCPGPEEDAGDAGIQDASDAG